MAGLPLGGEEEIVLRARTPKVTIALIAINVAIYVATSYNNALMNIADKWVYLGGFIPLLVISDPHQLYRFITSMFLHENLIHIFFNMYFLYIFGRAVENVLGSWRYLALYILSGLGASAFHTVFSALQGAASIEALSIPAIGASGAISGILGAYLILFPGTSLTACWWFFWIPFCYTLRASVYLIFWFILQVLYGYTSAFSANPGIAFFAHAGGFIAGIALLPLLLDRTRHYMLKMRTSLFNYIQYIMLPHRTVGLGTFAKIVLGIMIVSLIAGSIYAATSIPNTSVTSYEVNLVAYYTTTVFPSRIVKSVIIENHFVPVLSNGRPQSQFYSDINILFNRLYALGLLRNYSLAGKTLSNIEISRHVSIEGVSVPVDLRIIKAIYLDSGLLSYMKGAMRTQAVIFKGLGWAALETGIVRLYTFDVSLHIFDLSPIRSLALISIILAVAAIYTIYRRSSELALIT